MSFARELIAWYQENGRDLPWRATQDPYIIWLSEVILQQTRVEQGMPYFYRFVESYPTVSHFAEAPEDDILRLWQGLGYYSRARNMHKAAKLVLSEFKGVFPVAYADLIRLPGVGEYTAAAIASFSSNEAKAVVDGNVYRVLARYFGIDEAINGTAGKKIFASLAEELLDKERPGLYNQAIMDFGALQCKPKSPFCGTCVFQVDCQAYREGKVEELPVKHKAKASRNRYFHYFIVQKDEQVLMSQRGAGDVWTGLYEFPMLETAESMTVDQLFEQELFKVFFEETAVLEPIGAITKQVLSHQNIYARFYRLDDAEKVRNKKSEWNYFLLEKLDSLAKHKLIFSFLEENKELINLKL